MKQLHIQKTVFKVNDFLSWNRSGSLILSPAFQRRPVWPLGAKSFLIDTIVRALPMPIVFLRERTNPKTLEPRREVVDGQQRLRTVISYIEPAALKDFKAERDAFTVDEIHNSEIAGKKFSDLPTVMKQRILDYEFSVQVMPADTDDREVLQIFGRMNSTGYKLNEQELRNAEFFGAFKNAMYQLAYEQLTRWRTWKVFSETDIARMIEVEETSDIALTMFLGLHGKKQALINSHYRTYNAKFAQADEIGRRFRFVMDQIEDHLGNEISTLVFRRKPLFNSLFTFYYDLAFGLKSPLRRIKARNLSRSLPQAVRSASQLISSQKIPEDLAKVLRGATGHLPARQERLKFLQDVLRRGSGN
jgi:hypothetical protein